MYRLLLVDDEKMALIASLHSFPWESYGFAPPLPCGSPHEALALLRTEYFDAVFIDIRMPELSGIDIIRICRQEGIDVQFIVISGYSDFEYARAALQLFALDYCLKPVLPEDAVRVLERLSIRLFEVRLQKDKTLLESLESLDQLNRMLAERRILPVDTFVLLAALRCEDMPSYLTTLKAQPGEVYFLPRPDVLLMLSGDSTHSQADLVQRFITRKDARLCYCVSDTDHLQPSRQFASLVSELDRTTPETPVIHVRARDANSAFYQLLDYVDMHYAENLTLQQLAEKYHLNYTYLSELFKEMTGQTFTKHLTSRRMQKAEEMIQSTEVSLAGIAAMAGYRNYHHFAATFKAYFGKTPTTYRQGQEESKS